MTCAHNYLLSIIIAPGPISNLTAHPRFTFIDITWNAPQSPNGVITKYEVTYRLVDGGNTISLDLATTFTIPKLAPQTRVPKVVVTAYTRIGQGESANLSDIATLSPPCKF